MNFACEEMKVEVCSLNVPSKAHDEFVSLDIAQKLSRKQIAVLHGKWALPRTPDF